MRPEGTRYAARLQSVFRCDWLPTLEPRKRQQGCRTPSYFLLYQSAFTGV